MPQTIPYTFFSNEHKASSVSTKRPFQLWQSQFQASISLVYNRRSREQIRSNLSNSTLTNYTYSYVNTNDDQLSDSCLLGNRNEKFHSNISCLTLCSNSVDPNLKEYVEVEDDPSSHRENSKYMNPEQDGCCLLPTPSQVRNRTCPD